MHRAWFGIAVAAMAFGTAPATAATTIYGQSFAANFAVGNPATSVSGSFKFSYNTTTTATSLQYFSMMIKGVKYTPANVSLVFLGMQRYGRNNYPAFLIGGSLHGAGSMVGQTNDFQLDWTPYVLGLRDLTYTTAGTTYPSLKTKLTFSNFAEIPVAAVPEPATWAMMLIGLAMVGGAVRRRSGGRSHPAGESPASATVPRR